MNIVAHTEDIDMLLWELPFSLINKYYTVRRYFQDHPYVRCPNRVVMEKERPKIWSMLVPGKALPVTGTALRTTGLAQADSRQ